MSSRRSPREVTWWTAPGNLMRRGRDMREWYGQEGKTMGSDPIPHRGLGGQESRPDPIPSAHQWSTTGEDLQRQGRGPEAGTGSVLDSCPVSLRGLNQPTHPGHLYSQGRCHRGHGDAAFPIGLPQAFFPAAGLDDAICQLALAHPLCLGDVLYAPRLHSRPRELSLRQQLVPEEDLLPQACRPKVGVLAAEPLHQRPVPAGGCRTIAGGWRCAT